MFDWLLQYMDHNEQRTHQNPHIQTTVDRLAVIVTSLIRGIGLDVAKRMVGVLFTNCFQFSTRDIEARALYPLVSLVNHSCIPNISHTNLIQEQRNIIWYIFFHCHETLSAKGFISQLWYIMILFSFKILQYL